MIRGQLPFNLKCHYLNNGKTVQIYLYRDHPDIEKFMSLNEEHHFLTEQSFEDTIETELLKFIINKESFMFVQKGPAVINVLEYNFNRDLADFPKGKVAVLIDIDFLQENDNKKVINEIRAFSSKEEQ